MLRTTRAQTLLARRDPRLAPLRDLFTELIGLAPVGTYLAELITGLDTRYDPKIPGTHPWLGRLTPNLELTIGDEHTSIAELLTPGRPVLLHHGSHTLPEGWANNVDTYRAHCPAHPELQGLLIRPDGHTAWISTTPDPQSTVTLATALATWFGPPDQGAADRRC
ncbi:hypothetical protein [Streptomyces silvensis]|uniref:aromatic-ring hydroxylase C-terminal domain-containing protein n=1 Tax=Streptomyces silvensis TaxID=1765722 RepID=UPI00321FCEF1